jgi:hypothetical protein
MYAIHPIINLVRSTCLGCLLLVVYNYDLKTSLTRQLPGSQIQLRVGECGQGTINKVSNQL